MPGNATIRWLAVPILVALPRVVTTGQTAAPATIWAAPPGETLCEDYALRVNGQPVPVYSCRVSAVPFNQVWPGYQRPIDQTELAGFAHWGMSGPVSVEITSKRSFTNVVVRPGARAVRPAMSGRVITFALTKAGQVTVELDGPHHALHLFADPPEIDVVWSKHSCGLTVVEAQQPSQALASADLTRQLADPVRRCRKQDHIAFPLVVPLRVEVPHELLQAVAQRPFSKQDHL
jgi:hypothetical protein